jgi:hypothetical protein
MHLMEAPTASVSSSTATGEVVILLFRHSRIPHIRALIVSASPVAAKAAVLSKMHQVSAVAASRASRSALV